MLLVAPDPRLGIAPERIARVRVLLDAAPRAAGVAVALPGGADGVLDALVLRPDGVLGLLPGPAAGPASGTDDGSARGADELDRLLALTDPEPTAPRQVVTVPREADGRGGGARGEDARLALAAPVTGAVLAADEVRRVFDALRLVEHVPGSDALAAAGFAGHPVTTTAPVAALVGARGAGPRSEPSGGELSGGSGAVALETPPTAPVPTRAPERREGGQDTRAGGLAALGLLGAPEPRRPEPDRAWSAADGAAGPGAGPAWPRTGRLTASAPGEPRGRRVAPAWVWSWRGLAVAAALTFVVASGLALLVGRSAVPAPAPVAAADPTGTVVVGGVTYTRRAAATDTGCAGHAYGLAAQFLLERPCRALDRSLWSGASAQGPTVLAVSVVRMGDAASAVGLKSLVDSSGTGNLSDLLREGRSYPGGPAALTAAGYGSALAGDTVVIAEADWSDPARVDQPTLDQMARQAVDARVGRP